jgi:Mg-chelatase subunit ChlD
MKSSFAPMTLARCLMASLLGLAACKGAEVASPATAPARSGGRGGGALGDPGPSLDAAQIDLGAGSGDMTAPPPSPATMTCAEQSQKAMQVPLALMLVVDASSSMLAMTGNSTRYGQVREALEQFVATPASAGLGLGLSFFPQPGTLSACETDADCGYGELAPTPPPCQITSACTSTVTPTGSARLCGGGRNGTCPGGDTCAPLGRCAVTFDDCITIGQPCPGGVAGDTCTALGKTCEFTDESACAPAAYETPAVPVVQLPNPGQRLVSRAFARRGPSGSTPLLPAMQGALTSLRKYLAAHPGQKGALVLATDGGPAGCAPQNTIANAAALLREAQMNAMSVSTYVVGVATDDAKERMALTDLATAGGTGMPFIISATEILSQRFLETLNQIRGQALPCEFAIPKSTAGAIDFMKVNVHLQGTATQEDILYTGSAARCDATRGGWYYDADPGANPPGVPTRVIACPATCAKLKMQPEATVDLRFGCATRTID